MSNNQNKFKNSQAYKKQYEYVNENVENEKIRHNNSVRDMSYLNNSDDEDLNDVSDHTIQDQDDKETNEYPQKGIVLPSSKKINNNKKNGLVKGIKNLKGLNLFFNKYKIIIIICLIILFVFILLTLITLGMFDESDSNSGVGGKNQGYYDLACNFNKTKVNYSDENNTYENIELDEFIIGATYSYIKDGNYSEGAIKAIIIILKTNALSQGKYSNLLQKLDLKDFAKGYTESNDVTDQYLIEEITDIYEATAEEIYVSGSYKGTIKSLSESDILPLTDETLNKIDDLGYVMEYNEILDELYNSNGEDRKIYKIADNCTYYSLTENDSFWWPIGGSSDVGENIYSGTPTVTKITSTFGWREVEGKKSYHKGIDIGAACQSNVVIAAKAGTVTKVSNGCDNSGGYGNRCGGGYGNYLVVNHGDGTETYYAHMYPNSIDLKKGDSVKQGQKLGLVGNSGSSTGCHLHFEVRVNGTQVDPLNHVSVDNPRPLSQYNLGKVNDNVTSPDETKKEICSSLKNSGYSDNAVAAMLVNIQAEGSFLLNNLEGCYEKGNCCFGGTYGYCKHPEIGEFGSDDAYTQGIDSGAYPKDKFVNDRAGYGLIQWTSSGRKSGLYDTAKNANKSIASLSVQLGYLLEEVKKPAYSITYKYLTGNYSAYEIANNFCLDFESPKNENTVCPNRASSNTDSMLSYVKNNCS